MKCISQRTLIWFTLLILATTVCAKCHFTQPRRVDCFGFADLQNLNKTLNVDSVYLKTIQSFALECVEREVWNETKVQRFNLSLLNDVHVRKCPWSIVNMLPDVLGYGRLHMFNLSGNEISEFEWQRARGLAPYSRVDLRHNPLTCSCRNRWLVGLQHQPSETFWTESQLLQLPLNIMLDNGVKQCLKSKIGCPDEQTVVRPSIVNTTFGAGVQVRCTFGAELPNYSSQNQSERIQTAFDSFFWLLDLERPHSDRKTRLTAWTESNRDVVLKAENLTSDELGVLVCQCNHCTNPSFGTAELRFPTPLSATIHEQLKEVQLAVQGYPLKNLTMEVTRIYDNRTEVQALQEDTTIFFNGTFVSKFEAYHSFDFLKYFNIYVKECSLCLHFELSSSLYLMKICSTEDCVTIKSQLGHHRGSHPQLLPTLSQRTSNKKVYTLLFVAVVTISMLLTYFVTQSQNMKNKIPKVASIVTWRKNSRIRRPSRHTMSTETTSLREGSIAGSSFSNYSLQHVPIIERETLVIEEKIGKGAFGDVFVGVWMTHNIKIAVKMLNDVHVDAQMDKEAALLASLDHENVVKMYGVCKANDRNLYLVLELMNMGNLKTYVQERKPKFDNYSQFPPALLSTELIHICKQICTGLAYVSSQQIVHRDLAARNCLVSGNTDIRVCSAALRPPITVKISDFGMSRRIYSHGEYYKLTNNKGALPVRWLPPECLNSGKFTTQSDIWAVGVTLYEIFSFGAMPYGDLSNNEALVAVLSGVRPDIPEHTPPKIAEIMKSCWKTAPDERPCAEELLLQISLVEQT